MLQTGSSRDAGVLQQEARNVHVAKRHGVLEDSLNDAAAVVRKQTGARVVEDHLGEPNLPEAARCA
jgi:hypothetical protein